MRIIGTPDYPSTAEEEEHQLTVALSSSLPEEPSVSNPLPKELAHLVFKYALPENHELGDDPAPTLALFPRDEMMERLRAENQQIVYTLLRRSQQDVDQIPEPVKSAIFADLQRFQTAVAEGQARPYTIQSAITSFDLSTHSGLTAEKVAKIAQTFPCLVDLNFSGKGTGFNGACVAAVVEHLPGLRSITLNNTNLRGTDLAPLLRLDNLRSVSVQGTMVDHGTMQGLRNKGVQIV